MVDNKLDHKITEMFGFRPPTLLMMYSAITVLALMGVVGNVVSMMIWTRPKLKSSSSVLLTALAASDLLILIAENTPNYLNVLYYNYRDSPAITYIRKFITPYLRVWFHPTYLTAQTASTYLTLAITIERYIVVCHPFRARLVCTYRRSCKHAVAIITVSILYNLVEFLKRKVVARVDKKGDIKYYGVEDTELSQSPVFQTIYDLYDNWLYLIMIFLLPLTCIAVLNTLICLEMARVKKVRQALTNSETKENRVTLMLVYVVAEFLVCSLVSALYITIKILKLSDEQLGFKRISLTPLDVFFETFNSSSNVLTYIVFGSGFREALLSTFSCCKGLCRLRLQNGTDDTEMDVRILEIPNCQPTAEGVVLGDQMK